MEALYLVVFEGLYSEALTMLGAYAPGGYEDPREAEWYFSILYEPLLSDVRNLRFLHDGKDALRFAEGMVALPFVSARPEAQSQAMHEELTDHIRRMRAAGERLMRDEGGDADA